ncbi:hypothetical protein [Telmatospirillum sp. J64-1]|uniref:hypothetical protein n=1 Tax=Telmatospirillum sp. J64-1 TaxID=2502183 RepID=UPI00115C9691|nr:hypothetical protein [Telmatospirillum sp. J64-1]
MTTVRRVAWNRLPLFLLGALSLLAGMAAGLIRLGWDGPAAGAAWFHGALMVGGFFGTIICLERATALARPWTWTAPALSGLGGLALIAGNEDAGALLITAASLVFLVMAAVVLRRQWALFTVVLGLGALAWAAGNLMWLGGGPLEAAIAWWAAFLILTIAGERLELSRFLKPSRWRAWLAVPPLALVLAAPLAGPALWPVLGGGLLLLAVWLLQNDIARQTIRQQGLTRYVAVALLSGYGWLMVAGLLAVAAPHWDAILHAIFIGFVFAMVFGHAPVILPAVLRVSLPYTRLFYLPLAVLHFTLALRIGADLAGLDGLRFWAGGGNVAAILFFLILTASRAVKGRR